MDGLNFSAKDICAILKACKDSGVSSFKIGELEVDFDLGHEPAPDYHISLGDKFLDRKTYQATEEDSQVSHDHEDLMMQAAIENPVMWEKLEMGEVTDAAV